MIWEISQRSKVNSSTALHPALVRSLCEQRGDGLPIYPVLQLQKETLTTFSIENVVDVNSVSHIQDIFWNTYISQPKEWDLQHLEVQNVKIFQISLLSTKH